MNRACTKAMSEGCARHCLAQLKPLLCCEINPNKTRNGVKAVADYLHRVLSAHARNEAGDGQELYTEPLLDALSAMTYALTTKRLDRHACNEAVKHLKRVSVRIESN